MSARTRFFALAASVAVLGALAALPAGAEINTITLQNGTTFLTRYQPQAASWDAAKIVFLDEFGNQISLPKGDVVTIQTDLENRGFGHMLNSTTMALGWAPNDALDPDSEEGKAALQAEQQRAGMPEAPPVYNQEQFVEPGQATGIPMGLVGYGSGFTPAMGSPSGPTGEPVQAGSAPPPEQ
jgi:hypothetical protein